MFVCPKRWFFCYLSCLSTKRERAAFAFPKMGRRLFCRNKGFLYVQKYKLGDTVDVNCTSKESKPAADLTWYINRQPVVRFLNIAWLGIR